MKKNIRRAVLLTLMAVSSIGTTAKSGSPGTPGSPKPTAPAEAATQCRGILSQSALVALNAAKEDPAVTFVKSHPGAARPASVDCASKLWRAKQTPSVAPGTAKQVSHTARKSSSQHAHIGKSASRSKAPSTPAKKTAQSLSPDARRALSRLTVPGGQPPLPVPESETPYTGAPANLQSANPIRTPPLRDVRPIPPPTKGEEGTREIPEPIQPAPPALIGGPEPFLQTTQGATISAPTATGLNFLGVGVGLAGFSPSSNPPDVNGRIGATQYVQWNNTSFAVFDKTTGALLYGPAAGNTLFQSLGGACASHNDGDPVVAYDILAGRWLLSQFVVGASPSFSHQCVAVSATQDATGAYYLYDFVTDPTNFIDYPKIGVWPDGYYMTAHVFNAAGTSQLAGRVYVFERTQMLLGLPARQVTKDLAKNGTAIQSGFLPGDLDSLTPPPAGEAAFIIGPNAQFTNRTDTARVAVTWGATPTITLTEAVITTTGIGNAPCVNNATGRDCVPQPAPALGTDDLDNLSHHYMYRLAYRNFGGSPVQESLVVTGITAGTASTPSHGAVRWFEFRNAGNSTATPTVFQAATFDPDTAYRWMGSIAMDKDHNMALGYSKSSPTVIPGIFMTGRLGTDTINTMGAETTVFSGVGVQTAGAGNRWGDYTAMTLDPVDQCTFWYTNEYLPNNGIFNWATRIASYSFPSCTPAPAWGTVSGTITSCATGAPLSGVVVTLDNGFAGASDASGNYSISVPAGTYTATAADAARSCSSSSPASAGVTVSSGGTTTQSFCMTGTSNLLFNAIAIDDAPNGNANGIINANECVNLNVTVKNSGCASETAIAATLTTSTAGVTVTQNSSAYSDMVIDASSTNSVPFKIQTSNTFVCGTVINLTLNLTYASGSKAIGISVPTCAGGPSQSIPVSSIALTDSAQPDRLGRTGIASTCAGKACPGPINSAGSRNYKTFTFANSGGAPACITVQINAACGSADIQSAAYANSYTPPTAQGDAAGNLCLGYLGDTGVSGLGTTVPSASYSFQAPANSNFVVVVNTSTGSTTCTQFSGLVSGFFDFTPGPGACPACVPPATPTITPGGPTTFCPGGSVTLTSSAASGNQWYLNSNPIGGATNTTYNATATGSYTVTATAGSCTSPPSAATSVTVNPTPPTPTITPGGPTTFCPGGSVTLTSSSATGNQWSLNGNPIGGATNQTYVATSSGNYTVVVTSSGCSSAPSSATTVTVNPAPATPTITVSNVQTVTVTGGAGTFTLTFNGSGTPPLAFNATAAGVQGALNALPTIGGVGGSVGVTLSAGIYTVTFGGTLTGPQPQLIAAGSGGATATVNASPVCGGSVGNLASGPASATTYAWSITNGTITSATNIQSITYTAGASGTVILNLTVTNAATCSAASDPANVPINPAPATPTITPGGPTTFCTGGSVTLTSSSASGNQWSLNGNPIGGATNQTYIATASGDYTVVVTTAGCSSAASAITTVTVNPIPATPTITPGGPTTFCTGGSVTLTSSSASGNQWLLNGNPIGGATNQTYIATASGDYTVTVTSLGCTSAASSITTVTVNSTPFTPTITPGGPTTFCTGGSVTLTSSSASGNQWSLNGNPIGGATNSSYVATASGNYTVIVTTTGCTSNASAATTVTVNPIPATPTITPGGPTTFCTGGSVTLTSSSASGNQWLLNGNPIGGATNQTYIATASGNYTVTVTSLGCTSAASSATTVTVNPIPATPTVTPGGPTTFCTGGSVTLTSSSASGNQWLLNGNPIGGATNQTYIATASGNYTVTVTSLGCTSAASSATTVTVNPIPATPTVTPGGPTTFCTGGSVTLTSSSASGNQWLLNGNPIGGATNQAYIANASGNYTVTVTSLGCTSAASATTTVTVNPIPATPTITPGGPTTFCAGGSVTLTSSSATGNQWFSNGNPIGGATNQTFIATVAADYTVTVTTSGCTSAPSAATTVTVNPNPNATITAPANMVTATSAGASVANAGVGATYVWGITNGSITGGAGTASVTFTAGAAGTTTLNVTVTTAAGCSDAKSANVNVTALPAVSVTSVVPASGRVTGGSPITINGTGFVSGATVTIGGNAATGVVFVSSIKLTAHTPAHAAGQVNVTVTNPDTSNSTLTNGFTYIAQQFDANGDSAIDPSDIFYLVDYLFDHGPAPQGPSGMLSGDANGDGVVDPADIFYIVNYLFLSGPQPFAITPFPPRATTSAGQAFNGALSLGQPVTRDGRTFVPVILTMAPNSPTPQAMALKLLFESTVRDVRIHRAGAAANTTTSFEISRPSSRELSYIVAFDQKSGGLSLGSNGARSAVVAEVELTAAGSLGIEFDPTVTILSDATGTHTATVANGTLQVSGIDGSNPRPGTKRPGINQ